MRYAIDPILFGSALPSANTPTSPSLPSGAHPQTKELCRGAINSAGSQLHCIGRLQNRADVIFEEFRKKKHYLWEKRSDIPVLHLPLARQWRGTSLLDLCIYPYEKETAATITGSVSPRTPCRLVLLKAVNSVPHNTIVCTVLCVTEWYHGGRFK